MRPFPTTQIWNESASLLANAQEKRVPPKILQAR